MKRNAFAFSFVVMLATIANGFQSGTEWLKYESAAGRYSILMPKEPKLETQEGAAATGEKLVHYRADSSDADSMYSIAYFEMPSNLTYSLDKGRDGMVRAINGALLSEVAISLGGYAGREVKVSSKSSDYEIFIRARLYEIKGRIYILQHIYLKSSDSPTTAQKTTKFFDSFKVSMGS